MSNGYLRVFAALDGTPAQDEVARKAVQIAADNHAELRFGHVADAVPVEVSALDFEELCAEIRKELEVSLADILDDARKSKNIPHLELQVEAGSTLETLDKRLIAPFDPDLVVCGERGLSTLRYAFVGSVSTHLIRTLKCDVLVVKQRP